MTETRIGTFPKVSEFEKTKSALERLSAPFRVVSPEPGFRRVGVPSLVLDEEAYRALCVRLASAFVCFGWVEYRPTSIAVPQDEPANHSEDIFGEAAVMVLAPCVADTTNRGGQGRRDRGRLANLGGDPPPCQRDLGTPRGDHALPRDSRKATCARDSQASASHQLPGVQRADMPGLRRKALVGQRPAFAMQAGL